MEDRQMTIQQVVREYALSSRTLRYYEQEGLLTSLRLPGLQQRCYDAKSLERLSQIVVLRKLQIPIRDIRSIFLSPGGTALIEAFVRKLDALDDEIDSLLALREVVDGFLQAIRERGVTKATGMELLYEETERRLARKKNGNEEARLTEERLEQVSMRALKLRDVGVLYMPPMRVLTSQLQLDGRYDDFEEARLSFAEYGVVALPGLRQGFYTQMGDGEWVYNARIEESFSNQTPYRDAHLPGGLFAVAVSFIDEVTQVYELLRAWVDQSEEFVIDRDEQGRLRCPELLEEMYPWDVAERLGRYQQNLYVPIRWKEK